MRSNASKGLIDRNFRKWMRELPCLVCFLDLYRECIAGTIELHQVKAMAFNRESFMKSGGLDLIQQTPTEHAHVGDDRGMSQKCSDYDALPLCGEEHHREGPQSHHKNPRGRFFEIHGIDRDAVIAKLCREYSGVADAA